jgi:hypothetical protein
VYIEVEDTGAEAMVPQLFPDESQRSQSAVKVSGFELVHVPRSEVSALPSRLVPETEGRLVFTGAAAACPAALPLPANAAIAASTAAHPRASTVPAPKEPRRFDAFRISFLLIAMCAFRLLLTQDNTFG